MTDWMKRIPDVYKVAAALGAVLVVGFTVGAATTPFSELPETVREVQATADRNTATIDTVRADVQRVKSDMDDMKENIALTTCLELTERTGEDWRTCIK